ALQEIRASFPSQIAAFLKLPYQLFNEQSVASHGPLLAAQRVLQMHRYRAIEGLMRRHPSGSMVTAKSVHRGPISSRTRLILAGRSRSPVGVFRAVSRSRLRSKMHSPHLPTASLPGEESPDVLRIAAEAAR